MTSGLTLPGGAIVGHAAVTHIGVLPSFTRQGIATELIRHQLRDIAARGEVVATLRASEATIYERYGYGVASSSQSVEVQTARAALRPDVGTGGPVRLIDTAEAWEVLPRIYTENRSSRPGTIDHPEVWWQGLRLRTESASGASYVAIHGEPGSESGFARYRPIDTQAWFVSDQRTIVVEDFFAPTMEAYLGLLRFLLGQISLIASCSGCCRSTIRCPGCLSIDGPRGQRQCMTKRGCASSTRGRRCWRADTTATSSLSSPSMMSSCRRIQPPSPSRAAVPSRRTGAPNCTSVLRAWPRFCWAVPPGAVSPPAGWFAGTIRWRLTSPIGCSRCTTRHTQGSSSSSQRRHEHQTHGAAAT